MTQDELLQRIDQAAAEGWTELDLSGQGLTELPPEIGKLTQLETLILGKWDGEKNQYCGNRISVLPIEISKMRCLRVIQSPANKINFIPDYLAQNYNLQRLILSANQISVIPDSIAHLYNLKQIILSANQISTIPDSLAQLSNLRQLYLNSNQITAIPDSLAQLSSLQKLDLSGNQITAIPDSLAQLSSLQQLVLWSNQITAIPDSLARLLSLQKLYLSENQITAIPDSLAQLSNLQQLVLWGNQITAIPDSIAQLPNLQLLDLSDNHITVIPNNIAQLSSLKQLYLSENQITAVPDSLEALPKLERLDLRLNPVPISPEILGSSKLHEDPGSVEDIFGYLRQLRSGKVKPLNEAKMLLVGQGSVGKTSLIKQLMEGTFNPNEAQTDGLAVREWGVHVNSKDVRLNVWDFGGQEIYHATHQFFLTKHSLYILVCNCRTSEEENRIEYWLKLIQSFGGESPVIIVGNKSDEQPLDINRKALRQKYPNICAILETSCQTGQGIEELRATITKEVGKLREVYNLLPLSWFQAVRWYFQYFLRCPLVYLRILLALFVLGEAGSRDQGGINDHALQYRYPPSTEGGVDRLIDEVFYFVEDLLSLGSRPRYNSRAIRPGFSEAF